MAMPRAPGARSSAVRVRTCWSVVGVFAFSEEVFFFLNEAGGVLGQKFFEALHAAHTAEGVVHLPVEGDAQIVGEFFPGEVVELGGVHQYAVKVEENGL